MKNFCLITLLCICFCKISYSQNAEKQLENVAAKNIQAFTFDIGYANSSALFFPLKLGLNLRTKSNWNVNFDYDSYENDDLFPLVLNAYSINSITLRAGKLYRKGIWLYGASIGPSVVYKSQVVGFKYILEPEFKNTNTLGISPKASLIAAPLSWLGFGVSYNYNINSIESSNFLWFSVYFGRLHYRLKKYKTNYNNL